MSTLKTLLPILACLISFAAFNAGALARETQADGVKTELWHGKALTATFRVGVCFHPDGKTNGVLILRHANGDEDTYHLYGHTQNNKFELSHGSGHHFSGDLSDPANMTGKVRLKNGLSLNLKGERVKNAVLAPDDCAPLPSAFGK